MMIDREQWRRRAACIVTVAGLALLASNAQADGRSGCAAAFPAGSIVSLTGTTVAGHKNQRAGPVKLDLTADPPSSADAVPITSGKVAAALLQDGGLAYTSEPDAPWGNRCLDAVAPDGRRWSFLALNWERRNAHPNVHGVIDWSRDTRELVGFMDTKDGAYHEAMLMLKDTSVGDTARTARDTAEGADDGTRGSLCEALFRGDEGHIFVGTGYAAEAGTNPGHIALRLHPVQRAPGSITLSGHFIATDGPGGPVPHAFKSRHSACIDLPDPRYAMLQLVGHRGAEMVLWLWGQDNTPQKNDRLMGYLTFGGSAIERSKIALWRF